MLFHILRLLTVSLLFCNEKPVARGDFGKYQLKHLKIGFVAESCYPIIACHSTFYDKLTPPNI